MADKLRRFYIDTIGKEHVESISHVYRKKKRFYIHLAVSEEDEAFNLENKRETYSNKLFHLKENITIQHLLDSSTKNNMVLLQGAGGVGKTYMMDTAALHWAEGRIWKEVNFVFLLTFRELNLFGNISFKDALIDKYASILNDKAKFDKVMSNGEKIVFLLDGLDEFYYFENMMNISVNQCRDSSIASGLHRLINLKCGFFPRRTLIISGRPNVCRRLRNHFKKLSIGTYDVLGFTSSQVMAYIETYFQNKTVATKFKEMINKSYQLQLMSRVPAFLWSMCELHVETGAFQKVTTVTELYVWQLTIFLRQHYQKSDNLEQETSHMSIYKKTSVQNLVFSLATTAKMMLSSGSILIDVEDLGSDKIREEIERSGLFSSVTTSVGNKLQFNHMIIQEFLTAISYLHESIFDYVRSPFKSKLFHRCIPMIAGLQGALVPNSQSPKVVIDFVKNLFSNSGPYIFDLCFSKIADIALLKNHFLFLETFYEFQNSLSPAMIGFCDKFEMIEKFCHTYKVLVSVMWISEYQFCSNFFCPESLFAEHNDYEKIPNFREFEDIERLCNVNQYERLEDYFKINRILHHESFEIRNKLYRMFLITKRSFFYLKQNCKYQNFLFENEQVMPRRISCLNPKNPDESYDCIKNLQNDYDESSFCRNSDYQNFAKLCSETNIAKTSHESTLHSFCQNFTTLRQKCKDISNLLQLAKNLNASIRNTSSLDSTLCRKTFTGT